MSDVKIYHRTHRGCVYKCEACSKWHVLFKNFQLNMSENELRLFYSDVKDEVKSFCTLKNEIAPIYFESETKGGMLISLLKTEYLELEYLIGSSLILLKAERLLQNA